MQICNIKICDLLFPIQASSVVKTRTAQSIFALQVMSRNMQ